MKKCYLIFAFLFVGYYGFAEGSETVCVLANVPEGSVCNPSSLGPVNPCATIPFIVKNLTPPPTYVAVAKYE